MLRKCFEEFFGDALRIVQIEEGIHECDMFLLQGLYIVLDRLRIRGYDRAVIVIVSTFLFFYFIEYTGIENTFDSLVNQIHNRSVHEFGGIAYGFGRNGLHTLFKNGFGRTCGDLYTKAQLSKECKPERIILIHIQGPRQSDNAPLGVFGLQRLIIGEQPTIFIIIHIRNLFDRLFVFAGAAFTAITGDKTSGPKIIDGKQTIVRTLSAAGQFCLIGEILQFLRTDQIAAGMTVPFVLGDQCRAKGSHDSGNIRTHDLMTCDLLKGTKHGVIIEGSALNDNLIAHLCIVTDLDNLLQSIFYDRI